MGVAVFHGIFPHSISMWRIFNGILLFPYNIVMYLNNVMSLNLLWNGKEPMATTHDSCSEQTYECSIRLLIE